MIPIRLSMTTRGQAPWRLILTNHNAVTESTFDHDLGSLGLRSALAASFTSFFTSSDASVIIPMSATAMEQEPKERRYLIRRPKALQYFHNGQLMKAAEKERVAGRFELFFDLLYGIALKSQKSFD